MNNTDKAESTQVSTLICHRDVPMALKCLASLMRSSQSPIHIILHDDGSLQDGDIDLLTDELGSPTVVKIKEADEQMGQVLRRHPNCWRFRQENMFAKKIFDCVSYNRSDNFAYCDTDIYFFQPFINLFMLPNDKTNALFLKDIVHPYSIKLRDFIFSSGLQPAQNVNAGMIYFRRSCYDLDFIEWVLSKQILHSKPYLIEQTLWALLGQRASCRLWRPSQLVYMTTSTKKTSTMVAGHFVSPMRHLLKEYQEKDDTARTGSPVRVETVQTKVCGPIDLAWMMAKSELRRSLDRKPQQTGAA